jgi:hypothetical protein
MSLQCSNSHNIFFTEFDPYVSNVRLDDHKAAANTPPSTAKSPNNALDTLPRVHIPLLLVQQSKFTASGDDDNDPNISVASGRLADALYAPIDSSSNHNTDCIKKWTPTLEISPGFCVRLGGGGAEETWSCIEVNFFLPCTCLVCRVDICVIQDASLYCAMSVAS